LLSNKNVAATYAKRAIKETQTRKRKTPEIARYMAARVGARSARRFPRMRFSDARSHVTARKRKHQSGINLNLSHVD